MICLAYGHCSHSINVAHSEAHAGYHTLREKFVSHSTVAVPEKHSRRVRRDIFEARSLVQLARVCILLEDLDVAQRYSHRLPDVCVVFSIEKSLRLATQ
jgi:hypothetical protein